MGACDRLARHRWACTAHACPTCPPLNLRAPSPPPSAGVVVERPSSGNCFGYSVQEGDTLFDIATMVRPRLAAPPVPLWLWEWH
jgi:Tfp pilus assembly protein FimV